MLMLMYLNLSAILASKCHSQIPEERLELFFNTEDLEYITEQTNLYFRQFIASQDDDQIPAHARSRK